MPNDEAHFYKRFQELVDKLVADHPVFATELGDHRYDHLLGYYDQATLDRQLSQAKAYLTEFENMNADSYSLDGRIDHTIAIQVLKAFIRDAEIIRSEFRNPGTYLDTILAGIFLLIVKDFAPLGERLKSILGRMKEAPRVLDEGKANIIPTETPKLWAKLALESAQMGMGLFQGVIPALAPQAPELQEELVEAAQEASQALKEYAAWIEAQVLPAAQGDFKAGQELFETLLRENHMVDWDADWLLNRGEELYQQTLLEMERLAKAIDPGQTPKELIEKIKSDHPAADELLDVYRREMQRVRQFVVDRELVTIPPDEELKIVETPPFLRNQLPYAAYMPPGLLEESQQGIFVVTPVDPNAPLEVQEEKLRGHGRVSISITVVHEAYPGHHLQLVVANQNKSLPRLFGSFLSSLFVEGWAFYCEEMMEQQGYLNLPVQRLSRLQAQLWRASRIIVDVSLHTGRMTVEQAVQFMVEKANLEPSDAQVEVNRYTQSPTQPMSYLMGKYEILDIIQEYRRQFPDHDLKQMHDTVLRCGSLPPRLLRRRLFTA